MKRHIHWLTALSVFFSVCASAADQPDLAAREQRWKRVANALDGSAGKPGDRGGAPIVIDDGIVERVQQERRLIESLKLAPIAEDPMTKSFAVGALIGGDHVTSSNAFSDYLSASDAYRASIKVMKKELSVLKEYQGLLDIEKAAFEEEYRRVDKVLLPWVEGTPKAKNLTYWELSYFDLVEQIGLRDDQLKAKIKAGEEELAKAEAKLPDIKGYERAVEQFVRENERLNKLQVERERADELYKEITAAFGTDSPESIRRQLAALLATIKQGNQAASERSKALREEAVRRRNSNVGPGLIDFLQALSALGSLSEGEGDNTIQTPQGDPVNISVTFERKEYHFNSPKSVPNHIPKKAPNPPVEMKPWN